MVFLLIFWFLVSKQKILSQKHLQIIWTNTMGGWGWARGVGVVEVGAIGGGMRCVEG